jgi:hypothetical protein
VDPELQRLNYATPRKHLLSFALLVCALYSGMCTAIGGLLAFTDAAFLGWFFLAVGAGAFGVTWIVWEDRRRSAAP